MVSEPAITGYLGKFKIDPVPNEVGQWWYNTDEKVVKYFDGATVKVMGTGVYTGDTPPSNPKEGDLWWDTVEKRLKLYT